MKVLRLSFLVAGCVVFACAQNEIVRVDTELVMVPVAVMDRDARYLANLKKNDFEIHEAGILQETSLFEPVDIPYTILLLLDGSGSMNSNLSALARASNVLVTELRPDDRLIIATFSDDKKLSIVCPPTKKRDLRQLTTLSPRYGDGFTTTFDAVELAMKYMASFDGRRAIVLFSDGELFGRSASAKSNLRDAEEQDTLIYTVRFGEYPSSQPGYAPVITDETLAKYGNPLGATEKELKKLINRVDEYMHGLSEKTGGRSYEVLKIDDLGSAFRSVGTDLGRQYRLGYYPTTSGKDGERRKIKVKVNIPDVAVRSRNEIVYHTPRH